MWAKVIPTFERVFTIVGIYPETMQLALMSRFPACIKEKNCALDLKVTDTSTKKIYSKIFMLVHPGLAGFIYLP